MLDIIYILAFRVESGESLTRTAERHNNFISRGEVVMTLDGLVRGAEWRRRVKNDTESEGMVGALREVAESLGVLHEVIALDTEHESFWFEETASANGLESYVISRRRVKNVLNSLYSKYAEESEKAYKSGSLRDRRVMSGRFSAIVALKLNLRAGS